MLAQTPRQQRGRGVGNDSDADHAGNGAEFEGAIAAETTPATFGAEGATTASWAVLGRRGWREQVHDAKRSNAEVEHEQ